MGETPKSVRLNKYIADSGITSRRKADRLIEIGAVQINGRIVWEVGLKVDPTKDKVVVKGKPIRQEQNKVYMAFFKPEYMLSTTSDPEGRPTVMDALKGFPHRLFPVGRLDWNSEGLILLTNDGDFAQKVLHPKEEITKTYLAKLSGQPTEEQLKRLIRGVSIVGGRAAAKSAEKARMVDSSKQYGWVRIVITEGRNHQVRQMFAKLGFDVKKLRRIAIGNLRLGSMQKGEFRILGPEDLRKIFSTPKGDKERPRQKSTKRNPTPSRSKI